jgi:iron complex outermembrane receptor protein
MRPTSALLSLCLSTIGALACFCTAVTQARAAEAAAPAATKPPATIKATAVHELPPTVVTATNVLGGVEGTAESGYRHSTANLGPLGDRSTLETPFSIHAVSSDLLHNYDAKTFSEAAKYLPSTYTEGHFGLEFGPPVIRGLLGDDNAQSVRIDGLNVRADTALPVELYDKLEVLYGPSASLYGPSPAAGMINGVLKRPTATPLREVETGIESRGNLQSRADFSDTLGAFGYRVNLLNADGEGYAPGSNLRRNLVAAALSYRPTDTTLIEVLASHYEFYQMGYPGGFSYTDATGLPNAPDPTRRGYGQSFGGVSASTDLGELHVVQEIAPDWTISAAVMEQIARRDFDNTIKNTFTSSSGNYTTTYRQSGSEADVLSYNLYLNGKADTGFVSHDLALGVVGYQAEAYSIPGLRTGSALTLGSASLDNPVSYPNPGWGGTGKKYETSCTEVQSIILSDTLGFGEHWSFLAAINDSWCRTENWNASGVTTSVYDEDSVLSYSGSLLYKPWKDTTFYLTYADSIQPGDVAPATADNAGQGMAPYRSQEWELGVKERIARVDLTAAIFQIRRPFAYTDATDNVFKPAGDQVNNGLELTGRGYVGAGFTLFGSLTWLDPRMQDTANSATEGKRVVGVPRVQANLLAEYQIPFLPNAVLEANLHYVGDRAANARNTAKAEGYTTLDLGSRYTFHVCDNPVVARLMVSNVADARYWDSVYTGGGWTGTSAASGTAYLGDPRTIKLSVTMNF